jgi:hypothetical protein
MKKNEKNILTGVAVAAAGFLAYTLYKRKKQQADADKDKIIRIEQGNTTTGYPGPTTGPTEYQKKVMEIQSWLGVAVDGIPGPQTNGALSKKLSITYSLVGPISERNIDQYLALKRGPANLWF